MQVRMDPTNGDSKYTKGNKQCTIGEKKEAMYTFLMGKACDKYFTKDEGWMDRIRNLHEQKTKKLYIEKQYNNNNNVLCTTSDTRTRMHPTIFQETKVKVKQNERFLL